MTLQAQSHFMSPLVKRGWQHCARGCGGAWAATQLSARLVGAARASLHNAVPRSYASLLRDAVLELRWPEGEKIAISLQFNSISISMSSTMHMSISLNIYVQVRIPGSISMTIALLLQFPFQIHSECNSNLKFLFQLNSSQFNSMQIKHQFQFRAHFNFNFNYISNHIKIQFPISNQFKSRSNSNSLPSQRHFNYNSKQFISITFQVSFKNNFQFKSENVNPIPI